MTKIQKIGLEEASPTYTPHSTPHSRFSHADSYFVFYCGFLSTFKIIPPVSTSKIRQPFSPFVDGNPAIHNSRPKPNKGARHGRLRS